MTDTRAFLSIKQQDSVLDSNARLNIGEGSIRSGKTIASIARWLTYVRTAPPGPLAVIGRTRETIARNILAVIADMQPSAISFTAGASRCRILGRLIHVIGANDKKAEKVLRGRTLAGAYVDEATVIPEEFWTQLLGRLSVPGAKLFATTNPTTWRTVCARSISSASTSSTSPPGTSGCTTPRASPRSTRTRSPPNSRGFGTSGSSSANGSPPRAPSTTCSTGPSTPQPRLRRAPGDAAGSASTTAHRTPTHALLIVLTAPVIVGGRIAVPERLHVVAEWRHDGRAAGQLTDAQISHRLAAWASPLIEHLPGSTPPRAGPVSRVAARPDAIRRLRPWQRERSRDEGPG